MISTLKIATSEHEQAFESMCKMFGEYIKHYKNKIYYFELEDTEWNEEISQICSDTADYLSRIDQDSYAFIRIGDTVGDVQINGNPAKFGYSVSTVVDY